MKNYPHKPDLENVEFNFRSLLGRIEGLVDLRNAGKVTPNPRFFQSLAQAQVGAACESYALGKPLSAVLGYLKDASRNFAGAVTHGVVINPVEFVKMQATAVVAADA